ncbi:hypothetical protein IP92_03090 [Pseudoduganella flava]|uniref:Uncharacterized protein n=1 Tax=Pseudoduganella flava TaxID=871742 RepID=A0A562PQK1_9BURK|nr:hypothetical protein [Pseudoduganella flava]QGZ37893.1 hypothetical protein GO485_01735 [Pseudoduganella flava]TWI46727.1 hypothetical protein IP92_03090 [Pseudoduganella flava]
MGDGFFRKLWLGTAPLILWAAHFFFCYLYVAAGCGAATWAVLLSVTAVALALAGWLVASACRAGVPDTLLEITRLGAAVLGITGIAWSALPLLALGACG